MLEIVILDDLRVIMRVSIYMTHLIFFPKSSMSFDVFFYSFIGICVGFRPLFFKVLL